MTVRLAAIQLGALSIIATCSVSLAATPLVMAELDAKRTIAEADVARSKAKIQLAAWRLAQLKELKDRGHASWQEVAEQSVTTQAAAAIVHAAEQYLQAVLEWQTRLARSNCRHTPVESECIKLYMPQTARLVAWIPTEVASLELCKRHLENLRMEHQSLSEIDLSSFDVAIEKAKRAVEVYSNAENDADLLTRADIRLRLATAEYEIAKARKDSAVITAKRMELVGKSPDERQAEVEEPSMALARAGTRFVDATCGRALAQFVELMAIDETTASGQVAWLKHQRLAVLDRIESLKSLSAHSSGDPGELEKAKQQNADLELKIQHAQDVSEMQQELAGVYEQTLKARPTGERKQVNLRDLDGDYLASAAVVRHCLELQQLRLQSAANRAAIKAQCDYLIERLKRVERIPSDARPPKELENLHHRVQGFEQQLTVMDRELKLLDCEQQRFRLQVALQRGDPYQLVQVGNGTFIEREQFEREAALLTLIGFVGHSDLFVNAPTAHSYIESRFVLDRIGRLSFQSPASPADILNRTGWRQDDCWTRLARSSLCKTRLVASGLRSASDGITYPEDRLCYPHYGLRRIHLDYRSLPYDYLQTSVTCGFRSYYPFGSYAFGLSRPSRFSHRNRFPPRDSLLDGSSFVHRSALPTRNTLYSSPYLRPADSY